jgi:hypothetical protein
VGAFAQRELAAGGEVAPAPELDGVRARRHRQRGGQRGLAHGRSVHQHLGPRQGAAQIDLAQARLRGLELEGDVGGRPAGHRGLASGGQMPGGESPDHVGAAGDAQGTRQRRLAHLDPVDLDGRGHVGGDGQAGDPLRLLVAGGPRAGPLLGRQRSGIGQQTIERVRRLHRAVHGRVDHPDVQEHELVGHELVGATELRQRAGVVALLEQPQPAIEALAGLGAGGVRRWRGLGGARGQGVDDQQGGEQGSAEAHQNGFSFTRPWRSARDLERAPPGSAAPAGA